MTSSDPMPFGKYKGTPLSAVPREYSDWLCRQDGFKDKNPTLYAFFTQGEVASSTPSEREVIDVSGPLLASMSTVFQLWWARAYGERLRKQGEMNYVAYLRVAIAAWSQAEKNLAAAQLKPLSASKPKPPVDKPVDDNRHDDDPEEEINF